ncbi:AraC family transcriptional regulator [Vallitalea okinawensis]|uniref:AraC family transcriptional regulator n=1 Tax=Vallitalea okinawensis TaxID=2078660 RepID=UPI000CFBDEB6|nr:AraC family transcriptional regulator [Vallitalea okinawensis]
MEDKSIAFKERTLLSCKEYPINVFNLQSKTMVFPFHWHEHLELICLLEGQAEIHVGDQVIDANACDIIMIRPNEVHFAHSINNTKVKLIALVFNSSLLLDSAHNDLREVIDPYINDDYSTPTVIKNIDQSSTYFYDLLVSIQKEFVEQDKNYLIKASSLLTLFFVELSRNYPPALKKGKSSSLSKVNMARLRELFDYIERNYYDKITIEVAADIVGVTPNYFCKLFKKVTGRTFIQYLNLYRINKAEEIIQDSHKSITEISFDIGFCNVNYFDQVFKEYKGYSPSTIRKKGLIIKQVDSF